MRRFTAIAAMLAALTLGGCATETGTRTLAGGAIGAGGGALLGAIGGNAALGAAVGGAVGVAGGYLSSKYEVVPR